MAPFFFEDSTLPMLLRASFSTVGRAGSVCSLWCETLEFAVDFPGSHGPEFIGVFNLRHFFFLPCFPAISSSLTLLEDEERIRLCGRVMGAWVDRGVETSCGIWAIVCEVQGLGVKSGLLQCSSDGVFFIFLFFCACPCVDFSESAIWCELWSCRKERVSHIWYQCSCPDIYDLLSLRPAGCINFTRHVIFTKPPLTALLTVQSVFRGDDTRTNFAACKNCLLLWRRMPNFRPKKMGVASHSPNLHSGRTFHLEIVPRCCGIAFL